MRPMQHSTKRNDIDGKDTMGVDGMSSRLSMLIVEVKPRSGASQTPGLRSTISIGKQWNRCPSVVPDKSDTAQSVTG